jgi:ferredoxin-NADP reductase
MTEVSASGRVPLKPRLWQTATIVDIVPQSDRVRSFKLKPAEPFHFIAGQHAEVRLTAPDGYRAQRSYSISSAPEVTDTVELTIERLDDGEVSPFFHEVAQIGDEVEIRGPLGGHFIWDVGDGGPILLIGGGSGVCPLVSMVRHRHMQKSDVPMVLLFSARKRDEILFREELFGLHSLADGFQLVLTLTREQMPHPGHYGRRIDQMIMADTIARLPAMPKLVFVCGSNPFVEAASEAAMAVGVPMQAIKTERYGV